MDTLSWETTLSKFFWLPSEKGSTLKGKSLLPMGANSFLLEQIHLQKGLVEQKSKQKIMKVVSLVKMAEIYQVYPFILRLDWLYNIWKYDIFFSRLKSIKAEIKAHEHNVAVRAMKKAQKKAGHLYQTRKLGKLKYPLKLILMQFPFIFTGKKWEISFVYIQNVKVCLQE